MKHVNALSGFMPPHLLSGMAASTPILLALSGGADSVALLSLLCDYAKKHSAPLAVAHVNHKLRGADADADRDFCRDLAVKHDLPFYLLETDVARLAAEHHRGIEEEARIVRYDFFASLMEAHGIPLLVTAHHADDNAETVLLHLTRGSGLRGLAGIAPVRDFGSGKLIRPLLSVTKEEILAFCEAKGLAYVTDATNDDTDYARNRIRHKVIPELCRINPAAAEGMARLCRVAARENDFMNACAKDFLAAHRQSDGSIPLEALKKAHPALAARVVSHLLEEMLDEAYAVHTEAVLRLAENGVPHSSLDLGDGVRATVEKSALCFTRDPEAPQKAFDYEIPLRKGENLLPEADMMILIEDISSHKNQESVKNIYKKATTTYLSSATIENVLFARPRREGDVILTRGMHKKVKKLMCDRKIPLSLRARLPILCDAEGILWIPHVAERDGSVGDGQIKITLFYND